MKKPTQLFFYGAIACVALSAIMFFFSVGADIKSHYCSMRDYYTSVNEFLGDGKTPVQFNYEFTGFRTFLFSHKLAWFSSASFLAMASLLAGIHYAMNLLLAARQVAENTINRD